MKPALIPLALAPLALVLAAVLTPEAAVAGRLDVRIERIEDRKAVFATVESVDVVPARARIGGTLAELTVDEGSRVEAGKRIATVGDVKLHLQLAAIDQKMKSAEAEHQLARIEFERATELLKKGATTKARLDDARTRLEVTRRALGAMRKERAVVAERASEGAVLAPASGRVLEVHVTEGSVVMPGEPIATIAAETYVLRLRLPERHARFIREGDAVLVGPRSLSTTEEPPRKGRVRQVYPRIEDGRVVADVEVDGLGDYFVGERVPVHVTTGSREAFVVPREALFRRFGLDYARLEDGTEVVVQTGRELAGGRVEVLSGLREGDVVTW